MTFSHCHTTCLFNPVQLSPLFTTNLTFLFQLKILVFTKCDNCCRCQTTNDDYTELEFSQHPYSHVRKVQHFRHVNRHRPEDQVNLCYECSNYLIHGEKNFQNVWPSFMWCQVLNNNNVHSIYGDWVWRLVPQQWRNWWIQSIISDTHHSISYDNVTLEEPSPVIVDRTIDRATMIDDIESHSLGRIMDTMNKYLIPDVLCPWGCSEYMHTCGFVEFDSIIQRFLPKVNIQLVNSTNQSSKEYLVESCRDDYIRDTKYEQWLFNPSWTIKPTAIITDKNGPMICTCRFHNKGTNKIYLHTPRQPHHILPSAKGDQLCHAVIRPRTIKPMKASKFNTTYQMHEQRGSFQGIDTCDVRTYGDFSFLSRLLDESESRTIALRPDINSLLNKLLQEHKLSEEAVRCMRERSKMHVPNVKDYDAILHGCTYVPLEDALLMQTYLCRKQDIEVLDNADNPENTIVKTSKRNWPRIIYPLQKYDKDGYGTKFAQVPQMRSRATHHSEDLRLFWCMTCIITQSKDIWRILNEKTPIFNTADWQGWVLTYAAKNCFKSSKQFVKNSPFKSAKLSKLADLPIKFSNFTFFDGNQTRFLSGYKDIVHCFHFINSIYSCNSFEDISNNILPTQHEVVIVACKTGDINDTEWHENITIDNGEDNVEHDYELRTVISIEEFESWNGKFYSRHGGPRFQSWWSQERRTRPIQTHDFSIEDIELYDFNVFVYVKVKNEQLISQEKRNEFLSYIGGQKHIQCEAHQMPLIAAGKTSQKCQKCHRNVYICCPVRSCSTRLCKKCTSTLYDDRTHFIGSDDIHANNNNSEEYTNNENDNDDELSLLTPVNDDDNQFPFDQNINDFDNDEDNYDDDDDSFYDDLPGLIARPSDDDDIPEPSTRRSRLSRDDIDQYVTTADTDYDNIYTDFNDDEIEDHLDDLPTTNAGEYAFQIELEETIGKHISGHVLMNQCGSLLTRNNHPIIGFSNQKNFLQSIASTTVGETIPLLYLEGMLFPSTFYKMIENDGSICGAIPSSLFTGNHSNHGFATIQDHVRSRLTNPSSTTCTNPSYVSYAYDKITNLSLSHQDTRIVLNRGLTVDNEETNGIGVRGKADFTLFESLDSKKAAKSLCAGQSHHNYSLFLTFTCNQEKHFGVKMLRKHIQSEDWSKSIPHWENFSEDEKEEFKTAVDQAASPLLLRNWMEVRKVFFNYMLKTEEGPFKYLITIFVRDEYQPTKGNLSHQHLITELKLNLLAEKELEFIQELVRAQICNIVNHDEVEELINHGIFKKYEDRFETEKNASTILAHKCNQRCAVRIKPGNTPDCFRCRKLNNVKISPNHTQHCNVPLPVKLSSECKDVLTRVGLMEPPVLHSNGYEEPPVFNHDMFKPSRHIPPTNPTNDCNISPVIGYTFAATQSMQNAQVLTLANGANKYVAKYLVKIDEQNRVIIGCDAHRNGVLTSQSTFLHNTKVTTSKINEEKALSQQRNKNHPKGRAISLMEMYQVMLNYPEVITNLVFVHICTLSYELRAGIEKSKRSTSINPGNTQPQDAVNVGSTSDLIRKEKSLHHERQIRPNELLVLTGALQCSISIDKITSFSTRPPELRSLFNEVGIYYRFFETNSSVLRFDQMVEAIQPVLTQSCWIDGFHHQVKVRDKAITEVMDWLNERFPNPSSLDTVSQEMISIFQNIQHILSSTYTTSNEQDEIFEEFARKNLIHFDKRDHLPVPVYSYTKPTMGAQFILHILLSMGQFDTEYDLLMHPSLRDCLRYAKLIGDNNDEESLRQYSTNLQLKYFTTQLKNFPNSMRQLDSFIIEASQVFDRVIIHNEIPITDMPAVLQASIDHYNEEKLNRKWNEAKDKIVTAALTELEHSLTICNIPTKEVLVAATLENPSGWDALNSFGKTDVQSQESFVEQKKALTLCIQSINQFRDPHRNIVVNNNVIHGGPGCGKTFLMSYLALYTRSLGLNVFVTSLQAKRANQLGGVHLHVLFCLDVNNHLSPQRMAELAIIKLLKDPIKHRFILTLQVLCCDEVGNISAELISVLDIICRRIRGNNIPFGGIYFLGTMDHMQFMSINGKPFLLNSLILTCFSMAKLSKSVRAASDPLLQEFQNITRLYPRQYQQNPELLNRFKELARDVFTFVPSWDDPSIDPNTLRFYSRKSPARVETERYIEQVRRSVERNGGRVISRNCIDEENPVYSHRIWQNASEDTSRKLDQKLKEPRKLLFFKGATYEFTYNNPGNFQQSQLCVLTELPTQEDIDNFRNITVVAAPPGVQEVEFSPDRTTEYYESKGWNVRQVATGRGNIHRFNNIQAQRKQYGIKHRVTCTIHACLGDTVHKVATEISNTNNGSTWWDKAQVVVATSRTKIGKNTIFVGDRETTINALTNLVQQKNQFSEYQADVLALVSTDDNIENSPNVLNTTQNYPHSMGSMNVPNDCTGYVYFIMSLNHTEYTYIGETQNISSRLVQHNSGNGSNSTCHSYYRPFALVAYICGFLGNANLRQYLERQWKISRDNLIQRGITCTRRLINSIQPLIGHMNTSNNLNMNVDNNSQLRLVTLIIPERINRTNTRHG